MTSLNLMPMFRASTSLAATQSCAISVYMLVYELEITVIIQRINISLLKSSLINNIPSSQALPIVYMPVLSAFPGILAQMTFVGD